MQHVVETLARDGEGGVIVVTGEAGMGKSRLTGELTQWIARTPELSTIRVCEGGCTAYGQSAYDVQVHILNAFFGIQPDDTTSVRHEKIKSLVSEVVRESALFDILPYIENLMGVPPPERDLAERLRHLEPAQLRQQTFLAVRDLLIQAARVQPLFLIFEDLHWVDKPSLDLLLFLRRAVEEAPIALVCISRASDNQAVMQLEQQSATAPEGHFTKIALEPLSLRESNALIDLLLTIADLPENLRQMIPQRAEGNPFYLEEIIRALIDRNIIRRRQNHWELTPGADALSFQVPRTLESLIMTRLDHLSESTRYTAQCAAVIGRDFSDSILFRITDMNLSRLENDLQELVDHELVQQSASAHDRQYCISARSDTTNHL